MTQLFDQQCAIVDSTDTSKIKFVGTYKECCDKLKKMSNREYNRSDLRYYTNGKLGRMASFVLSQD